MATPEEITAAIPARDALSSDVQTTNSSAYSISGGFTAGQVNWLNQINPRIDRIRNDGDLWLSFVAGDTDYQHLGAYMKSIADSLNMLRSDLGMQYGSFADFWKDVVAKTAGDVGTAATNAANTVAGGAPYVMIAIVLVLVLILAIKVS